MATSTLSDALAGLNFGAGDTGYGIAANSLAAMAPKMINPYGSVGQNLGVGLGSVLLTALLQYQGKKSALEDSLQSNKIANDLMATTSTPEERTAYIENLSNQGIDSNVVGKLSTLATALTQSDKEQAQAIEARKQATLQDLYGKIAAEEGVPYEAVPGILKSRMQSVAGGDAIASGVEGTTGSPGFKTQKEKAAEAVLRAKWEEAIDKERSKLNNADSMDFIKTKAAYETAMNTASRNTEAGKLATILLFNRILNPGNQVTLQEADATGKADAVFTRWSRAWNSMSANEKGIAISKMSPEALKELIDISRISIDAMGKQYNERVTNSIASLKNSPLQIPSEYTKVQNVAPSRLHLTEAENTKKNSEIDALTAGVAQVMASPGDKARKDALIAKARNRILEIQSELENDFQPIPQLEKTPE